ncbi:MAG: alcohol dehydrogenase catalytic domain-containing protein [Alphaproteobacteria bacterium]|nr:alcohol dehydrogenase catalytic domain-containing protein [Alphaproteobacteria bacterium]MDX5369826.1 alcohol dehydrogenase catalytic domain-containing protein [Alphaproteobacteria bacterium]
MLALQKTRAAEGLELREIPALGAPGPGEVLLRVAAAGICGSDVHVYNWSAGYDWMEPLMPITLGHEFSAKVEETGPGVSGLRPGDRVTVAPTAPCLECPSCLRGDIDFCSNRTTIGLHRGGAFAPFVLAPARSCLLLDPRIDDDLAALTEPLCVGENAARVAEVEPGDTVLVLGPGTIGQACAFMARVRGAARIIVAGKDDALRLGIARALADAETLDLADGTLADQVMALTGGRPVDRVIEATGVAASITDALPLLRRGGILAAAGIHAHPLTLDLTPFIRGKHQLRAAYGSTRKGWESVVALMPYHAEQLQGMISHRLPLSEALEGFALARARKASKVILRPA